MAVEYSSSMILRHCGMRFGLVIVVLAMSVERSLASAAARSVLGTVTPDTMGMGEDLRIRWNYEDGNGGVLLVRIDCIAPFHSSSSDCCAYQG